MNTKLPFYTQDGRRHGTTTNRTSIKKSSECVGGLCILFIQSVEVVKKKQSNKRYWNLSPTRTQPSLYVNMHRHFSRHDCLSNNQACEQKSQARGTPIQVSWLSIFGCSSGLFNRNNKARSNNIIQATAITRIRTIVAA